MNPPMRSIGATSLALILIVAPVWAADQDRPSPQLHCGAYCLYLGLKSLDVPLKDFKELEGRLGQPSPLGYSMEQLAESARSFGAHALGVQTSLENLRRRPNRFACIALLKEGHYVNLYEVTWDRVYLIDPPKTKQVGLDGFRAIWTGKALLLSDRPIPDESTLGRPYPWLQIGAFGVTVLALAGGLYHTASRRRKLAALSVAVWVGMAQGCRPTRDEAPKLPVILVQPSRVDLGDVTLARDGEVSAPIRIANPGTADLRIFSVKASCGCTFAQAPLSLLGPDRDCTMRVVVRPGIEPGARESMLTIQSNDPVNPLGRVPVTWRAISSVYCEPSEINLGRLRPGQRVERRVSVRVVPGLDVGEVRAQTGTAGLATEWEPSGDDSHGPGRGRTLVVRFTAGPTDEDSAGMIALTGTAAGLATMVPVRWKVVSRLSVRPSALFTSGVPPRGKVTARLVLEADDRTAFGIKAVTIDDRICTYKLDGGDGSGPRFLEVDATAPDRSGAHRLSLRIESDLPDAKPIFVPWSMAVR